MLNKDIAHNYKSLIALKSKNIEFFPINISYKIIRNLKLLRNVQEDIDEAKQLFLDKYGTPDEEQPGYYFFKTREDGENYHKQVTELENTDTPVDLSLISLNDLNGMNLSLEDMDNLYFMIEEGQ